MINIQKYNVERLKSVFFIHNIISTKNNFIAQIYTIECNKKEKVNLKLYNSCRCLNTNNDDNNKWKAYICKLR